MGASARAWIGCAGWSLPHDLQKAFGPGNSHLARYATRLDACEINSSFHRPHARSVYERWAASVPAGFRFSVKLPRTITHDLRLRDCEAPLDAFMDQAAGLGEHMSCLLVQLPPKLEFEPDMAGRFFTSLRSRWTGHVAVEPRHATWFDLRVDEFLGEWRMARVLADPVRHPGGERPGGWQGLVYLRLHGSPRVYYSSYDDSLIERLTHRIGAALRDSTETWCIFDNTASGAAVGNALALRRGVDGEKL